MQQLPASFDFKSIFTPKIKRSEKLQQLLNRRFSIAPNETLAVFLQKYGDYKKNVAMQKFTERYSIQVEWATVEEKSKEVKIQVFTSYATHQNYTQTA